MPAIIFLLFVTNAFAAENSPTPLKLSPFPNGLEYKPTPEPSNSGNPLLDNTHRVPGKPKNPKPPVGIRGGGTNGYGAGAVKGTVGTF